MLIKRFDSLKHLNNRVFWRIGSLRKRKKWRPANVPQNEDPCPDISKTDLAALMVPMVHCGAKKDLHFLRWCTWWLLGDIVFF